MARVIDLGLPQSGRAFPGIQTVKSESIFDLGNKSKMDPRVREDDDR
jgi:hypothetical protein